jgi:DNA modification methylase
MGHARYLVGDVYDRLKEIPDGSIDLVVTSPPFLALRSYLPSDHPNKDKEIGSEATPAAFLDTLLALTAEWRRVLAPHGSICVELGDTYSGSGNGPDAMKDGRNGSHDLASDPYVPRRGGHGWPLDKSLCGIPTLYAWSLAYGRNLLTGEPSPAGQWRIRNLLVWARPNPPVGALGDKWRPATSYVTVACVGRSRYFDLDAVRTEHKTDDAITRPRATYKRAAGDDGASTNTGGNPAGAPPLDWCDERDTDWQPLMPLPTQPYSGSHYATFPTQLPKRLIECMAPQKVCTVCGKPSERVVDVTDNYREWRRRQNNGEIKTTKFDHAPGTRRAQGMASGISGRQMQREVGPTHIRTGWTDCGCPVGGVHYSRDDHRDAARWRPGIVLDPFAGSGTTLAAATGCGRDAIGIDLAERNADLARDRVGMFLEIEA